MRNDASRYRSSDTFSRAWNAAADDAAVAAALAAHRVQGAPVVAYYGARGMARAIDATGSDDATYDAAVKALEG